MRNDTLLQKLQPNFHLQFLGIQKMDGLKKKQN